MDGGMDVLCMVSANAQRALICRIKWSKSLHHGIADGAASRSAASSNEAPNSVFIGLKSKQKPMNSAHG
jgi:hypothetical protein